jgi:Zn-dependent protease with chaperone function
MKDLPSHSAVDATDSARAAETAERHRRLAAGTLPLPNLALRGGITLFVLYGLLGLLMVILAETGFISPLNALGVGVALALVQYLLAPWLIDLSLSWAYSMTWVKPEDLPLHLREFVARVCAAEQMRFPSFGLIHDGAPQAFTYGHRPGNARIVISQGLLDLLEPGEAEAVVAHEIGHARNWDMVLMTIASVVPLLAYSAYRALIESDDDDDKKGSTIYVAVAAYVVYIATEYLVLWFSRTREYAADRYAARVTGAPNSLATALVKIAYGLAAQDKPSDFGTEERKHRRRSPAGAIGALNIFDRGTAVSMVMASGATHGTLDPGRVKNAMQWDLWNPWAGWHEIHSTHPLVARRIDHLGDLAAALGQRPLVVFDRHQPESYWDEFLVDVFCWCLPVPGFLVTLGAGVALAGATSAAAGPTAALPMLGSLWVLAAGLLAWGGGKLLQNRFRYSRGSFPNLTVAALLGQIKVSAIRPVPTTLTGTIIGKGVPGLVWSEDFVLRDDTGIMFLDYRQPMAIWEMLFGFAKARAFQGANVRVSGWYRRAPQPFLQIDRIEVIQPAEGRRPPVFSRSYVPVLDRWFGIALVVAGGLVATLAALGTLGGG